MVLSVSNRRGVGKVLRGWAFVPTAMALVVGSLAALSPAAVVDDFESFSGASGTTVNGYSNYSTSTGAVVIADGTAYAGAKFLRLPDTSTTAAVSVTKVFAAADTVAVNGSTASFALRTDSGFNTDEVFLYSGASFANANIVARLGIRFNGPTSANFAYVPYNGGTAGSVTVLNTANTPITTAAANTWYRFDLTYAVGSSNAGTYSLKITAPNGTSMSFANLAGQTAVSSANYYGLSLQTNAAITGNADFDALSVAVPEPASLGAVGVGAALLLRRRRVA